MQENRVSLEAASDQSEKINKNLKIQLEKLSIELLKINEVKKNKNSRV